MGDGKSGSSEDVQTVVEFYDNLSSDYDALTAFEKRFVRERPFFHFLVEKYRIKTALDAGCGTGFHSFLLAQLGVKVTAVDASGEMLKKLDLHAKQLQLEVEGIESSFEDLGNVIHQKFDAVFSLGNSLVHLLTQAQLLGVIKNFYDFINPGGIIFLQILNYKRILEGMRRVQSVKVAGDSTFVRFYDFGDELLRFNILKINASNHEVNHTLQSVSLRPLLEADLLTALKEVGFSNMKSFGGISMEEFDPELSQDLVIVATRGV